MSKSELSFAGMSKAVQQEVALCPHPAWIEIDGAQFAKNIAAIRKKIVNRRLCMAIKANAYGHGLREMGRAAEAAGADCLGVACLQEGAELRLAGIKIPILVFGAVHEDQIGDLIAWNLEFSISSRFKASLAEDVCKKLNKKCRIHIEVDTGMHRTGMRPSTAIELVKDLERSDWFDIAGIYSHLATSDVPDHPFAKQQIALFHQLAKQLGRDRYLWHLANSGGVAFYPDSYFDMVRPGLLCYGYFPDGSIDPTGEVAPCFSVKAKVSYFKVVLAGSGISYGHRYIASQEARVVTVPVGYGDGYRRAFSNRAEVLIRGKKYRVAGTVCMDQFMLDIGSDSVFVGDEVTLVGRQGQEQILLTELAELAGTIPYELLCGFSHRLPRVFTHRRVLS